MKKVIWIVSIVLIIAAAVCFGLSVWYDHLGGSVMDGPGDFYANAYRQYRLFLGCGIGLLVADGVLLAIRHFMK